MNWEDELERYNDKNDGCGIESIVVAGKTLHYVNTGDTYTTTLCYDESEDEIFEGAWGDWLEETEGKHCADNNVIMCGYCGEFTPNNEDNWHDVTCEHCDNLVGG